MSDSLSEADARLLRELAPAVLAVVTRRSGDFAAAEDAVQESLLAASVQWPRQGLPDNPRAWLIHVATRRLADHRRSDSARCERERFAHVDDDAAPNTASVVDDDDPDDTLTLLYLCCHPSLTTSSSVALTLRAVGGLTTAQIAHAFLVPEATMAQRISRAKRTIKESGLAFEEPCAREREQRLAAVLHVLYLIFNEGYASSGGPHLQRHELADEAIRLTRLVGQRTHGDVEASGLLALMLLTDARRAARCGPRGELIPLPEQDRSRWDRDAIGEGVALVSRSLTRGRVGPYQLQAAIAAVHDEAMRAEDTDWPQILALYGLLARMSDNPMVALNQTVAFAMVHGAEAGLARLHELDADARIARHHRLAAVRGHLHERAGNLDAAAAHYREAAARTASVPERDYLLGKASKMADVEGSRATDDS